jgi:hypothetical protein
MTVSRRTIAAQTAAARRRPVVKKHSAAPMST